MNTNVFGKSLFFLKPFFSNPGILSEVTSMALILRMFSSTPGLYPLDDNSSIKKLQSYCHFPNYKLQLEEQKHRVWEYG